MAEHFFITANYVENKGNNPIVLEAPKYLRYESFQNVIDYLLSEQARKGMKQYEINIARHIERYMKLYRQRVADEEIDLRLVISLKNQNGVFEEKENDSAMPDLDEKVTNYVRRVVKNVEGEDVEIDLLEILFAVVPRVGYP